MNKQHVSLTSEDRVELEEFLSKGSLRVRVQKRALALQLLNKGMSYQDVSSHVGISHISLSKWAKRYKVDGLSMLYDKPRSGRPAGIRGEERAKVTALACTTPPEGYAKWSLRLLAERLVELDILENISHTEVGRILKKTNCSLTEKSSGASER
ncbi:MAG: helix-turn-helix domain-containing protein [Saprospiraceae bacterium]|nr:helix-turn-helix domain-containing protein [Saprospiraceae bacterium]